MQLVRRLPFYGSLLLLAYMPFHVFLSQSVSLLTGDLNEWKVAKDVFLAILTILTVILVYGQRSANKLFKLLTVLTIAYAALIMIVWAAHPHIFRTSAVLGATYDLRLFCYTLVGFGAVLLMPEVQAKLVLKLIIIVSTIVATLGVIQYFLSPNILTHLGYSVARGVRPNFFIDNNPEFPRIMSTIRDPNSLGDYLLVPVGLLTAYLLRARKHSRRILFAGLLVLHMVAVYLTFSRSAWIGAVIVIGLVIWWQYRHWFNHIVRRFWPIVIALVLIGGVLLYSQRNNSIITHQTKEQVGKLDSNQLHLFFIDQSLNGFEHEPFGHGPGTAGLASIHNPAGSNLTENYYLQVAYETGVIGLVLFVGMQVLIYIKLWPQRHTYLGLVLLASFWAYVIINMVLQEWDNEAVAAQWWILAGLSLGLAQIHQVKKTEA
jgi:hypothetical protein